MFVCLFSSTRSSLAALGLVENNAPNITAAMLVSPLMGPVMSITFGAMISDRELIVRIIHIQIHINSIPTHIISIYTFTNNRSSIWVRLSHADYSSFTCHIGYWTLFRYCPSLNEGFCGHFWPQLSDFIWNCVAIAYNNNIRLNAEDWQFICIWFVCEFGRIVANFSQFLDCLHEYTVSKQLYRFSADAVLSFQC